MIGTRYTASVSGHVFEPVVQVEEAVRVEGSAVAGAQPAAGEHHLRPQRGGGAAEARSAVQLLVAIGADRPPARWVTTSWSPTPFGTKDNGPGGR